MHILGRTSEQPRISGSIARKNAYSTTENDPLARGTLLETGGAGDGSPRLQTQSTSSSGKPTPPNASLPHLIAPAQSDRPRANPAGSTTNCSKGAALYKYEAEFEELQLALLWFPEEVAYRLTEVEYDLFKQVHPSEYLRHATLDMNNFKSCASASTYYGDASPAFKQRQQQQSQVGNKSKQLASGGKLPEIVAELKAVNRSPANSASSSPNFAATAQTQPQNHKQEFPKSVQDLIVRYKEVF